MLARELSPSLASACSRVCLGLRDELEIHLALCSSPSLWPCSPLPLIILFWFCSGFWRDPPLSRCCVGFNPASDRTGRWFKWPACVGLMKKAFERCISSADTAYSRALFCISVLLRIPLVKSQPDWKSCHHHCSEPALVIALLDTLRVAY